MKELEELAETNVDLSQNIKIISKNNDNNIDNMVDKMDNVDNMNNIGLIGYIIWSLIIYVLFVLFFILLNQHLSYLQIKLYQLVFVNKKLNNVIKFTKAKQSDSSKPIADILKLTSTDNDIGGNVKLSTSQTTISSKVIQIAPKWSKLIFIYQLISIQCIGTFCYLFLSLFKSNVNETRIIIFGSLMILIGNEFGLRSLIKLQLPYHPDWLNHVLYFLFGSMVVSMPSSSKHKHSHSHSHSHSLHCHQNKNQNNSIFTNIFNFVFKIFQNIPSFIQHIRETKTSRRIFIFLSINFYLCLLNFSMDIGQIH